MLMATCCEDDVVPHVLPFVKDNISHQDWRYRDAAVMAFGTNNKHFCFVGEKEHMLVPQFIAFIQFYLNEKNFEDLFARILIC